MAYKRLQKGNKQLDVPSSQYHKHHNTTRPKTCCDNNKIFSKVHTTSAMEHSELLDPQQLLSPPFPCSPSESGTRRPPLHQDRPTQDFIKRYDLMKHGRYDNGDFVQNYGIDCRAHMRQGNGILRNQCKIEAKHCFVISITEEGDISFYFSADKQLPTSLIPKFFNSQIFLEIVKMHANDELNLDEEPDSRRKAMDRCPSSTFKEGGTPGTRGRKRPRSHQNEQSMVTSVIGRPLAIDETDIVWEFYQEQFRNCQQTACKLIAKAWVKAVEPKKQSAHPYTGTEVPDWWPKPWGPSKEDAVRHKEPDHLYKRERIHLLSHILRMVVKPRDKQHPDIQKVDLSVQKLKETTFEALSSFLAENEANGRKMTFLNELFRVAMQEWRHWNGEIDGPTQVPLSEDEKTESCVLRNEEKSFIREEDGCYTSMMGSTTTQGLIQAVGDESTSANTPAGSPMSNLHMRRLHFTPSIMAEVTTHSHSFETGRMPGHGSSVVSSATGGIELDMATSPYDNSRRSLVSSDYSGTYSNTLCDPQWQLSSTVPTMPLYTAQQPNQVPLTWSSQNIHMSHAQPFLANSFESSSHQEFEQGSHSMVGGRLYHIRVISPICMTTYRLTAERGEPSYVTWMEYVPGRKR